MGELILFLDQNQKVQNKRAGLNRLSLIFLILFVVLFTDPSLSLGAYPGDDEKGSMATETSSAGAGRSYHVIGGSLGHTILFGDWESHYADNFSFGVFYAYEATPIFGFIFHFGYGSFSGPGHDNLAIWSLEPNLKVNLFYFDNISFAVFGGFGLYPVSQKIGLSEGKALCFGMNLGFSVDLHLGEHLTFGPAIQFRSVFTKTDRNVNHANYPTGMTLGGENIRLFVQAGYAF